MRDGPVHWYESLANGLLMSSTPFHFLSCLFGSNSKFLMEHMKKPFNQGLTRAKKGPFGILWSPVCLFFEFKSLTSILQKTTTYRVYTCLSLVTANVTSLLKCFGATSELVCWLAEDCG